MTTDPSLGQWPDKPPRAHQLIAVIRKLAGDSGNVGWTQHALDRLVERDISDLEALRVLRRGDIEGLIEPHRKGEWKCKVVFLTEHHGGVRTVGVVTIVKQGSRLLIKTVEWENFR
jgi:hypothetical protein